MVIGNCGAFMPQLSGVDSPLAETQFPRTSPFSFHPDCPSYPVSIIVFTCVISAYTTP